VTIQSSDGADVLLHIGIDTVKLGGKHFESHVSDGQEIKKGDLLVTFDIDAIKAEGYKLTTPLIIGNTDDYSSFSPAAQGKISAGDIILRMT
ncbi:MAG: PTS glucose transporter subunit IIA, partial [Lachnospiraceae bacterium]|nr:PTS glucose transporter subunit IIA [Lachnospiraceae bacterium]